MNISAVIGVLLVAWGALLLWQRRWFAAQLEELTPGRTFWVSMTVILGVSIIATGAGIALLAE